MGPLDTYASSDPYWPPRFSWNLSKPWESLSVLKQQFQKIMDNYLSESLNMIFMHPLLWAP